jgi:hypothetical protein
MAVPRSLILLVSIVIVGAEAVWSGVGTLAVALGVARKIRGIFTRPLRSPWVWWACGRPGCGEKDTGYLYKALAVALVIYHSLSTVPD